MQTDLKYLNSMSNMVLTTYSNTGGLIIYSAPYLSAVCLSVCICSDVVCRHSGTYCLLCSLSLCCLSTCLYLFWRRIQTLWNFSSAMPPFSLLYVYLFLYLSDDVFRHRETYCLLCHLSVCCMSACFCICLTSYPNAVELIVCSAPCLSAVCLLYLFVSVLTTYPDAVELVVC